MYSFHHPPLTVICARPMNFSEKESKNRSPTGPCDEEEKQRAEFHGSASLQDRKAE